MMKKVNFSIILIVLVSSIGFSQVYTNKVVGKKQQAVLDSMKVEEYPYSLPIWGEKATKKGYQLPYSAGVSVNYFWQKSDIEIKNLMVGFNNGPLYDLDQIVRFNKATAEGYALNVRPDIWLFPFLNIYGVFGKANMSTAIDAGIWVPDGDNNWSQVYNFATKANFEGTTAGLGITPTIGVAGGWLALDMNVAWTDISTMKRPAQSFIFGPRFGKTFNFNKPEQNIAVWVGAFRVHLKSGTEGSINFSDIISTENAQSKVDNAIVTVNDKQIQVDDWWSGLSNIEQANPVNKAKYETANKALDSAGNLLAGIDGALSTANNSVIQYSLEKSSVNKWNFIVGSQYQFNRHFMLRAEAGFLGSRTQFMTSLQYRFGL